MEVPRRGQCGGKGSTCSLDDICMIGLIYNVTLLGRGLRHRCNLLLTSPPSTLHNDASSSIFGRPSDV